MKKRIAIYPDSFDPPSFGHLRLIRRAAELFDGVLLYIEEGKHPLTSAEQRAAILRQNLSDLTELEILRGRFSPEDGNCYFILRPLVKSGDLDTELMRRPFYNCQFPDLDVIYLPVDRQEAFLSGREAAILCSGLSSRKAFFPDVTIRCPEETVQGDLSAYW